MSLFIDLILFSSSLSIYIYICIYIYIYIFILIYRGPHDTTIFGWGGKGREGRGWGGLLGRSPLISLILNWDARVRADACVDDGVCDGVCDAAAPDVEACVSVGGYQCWNWLGNTANDMSNKSERDINHFMNKSLIKIRSIKNLWIRQ